MTRSQSLTAGILLILLVSQVPIFVQLTLTPDAVLYDIQARCLVEGGVLYRDVLEPNLPGIVWVHLIVRSVAGWSPEVLRVFDLCVVGCACLLLVRLARSCALGTPSSPGAPESATFSPEAGAKGLPDGVLFVSLPMFYLGTSEWCHCQRDVWMLLPSLLAMTLRMRVWQIMTTKLEGSDPAANRGNSASSGLPSTFSLCERENEIGESQPEHGGQSFTALRSDGRRRLIRSIAAMAVLEGVLWGAAFWLKPFVAVPALAVILASRRFTPSFRSWGLHSAAVLFGGAIAGAAGVLWMIQSGCWTHFIETLTSWNGDYFRSGRSRWTLDRFAAHAVRFFPWILLHVPAVVISVRGLFEERLDSRPGQALLQSLYLGWMLQAFLFQQMFDYVHAPGMLLAIAVCARRIKSDVRATIGCGIRGFSNEASARRLMVGTGVVLLFLVLVCSPLIRAARLQHWLECVRACFGNELSPKTRDDLSLVPFPRWSDLQPMLDYLKASQIPDRSLVAYNGNLIHLYPELNLRPSTRFVYLDVLARLFPDRRGLMTTELTESGVQWVVSDLIEDGREEALVEAAIVPTVILQNRGVIFFPYNQSPVYRSGGYVLFRIDQPIGKLTDKYFPLAELPR